MNAQRATASTVPAELIPFEERRIALINEKADEIQAARDRATELRAEANSLEKQARDPASDTNKSQGLYSQSRAKMSEALRIERVDLARLALEQGNIATGNHPDLERLRNQAEKEQRERRGERSKETVDLERARQMGARKAFQDYLVQIADPTLIRLAHELRKSGVPHDVTLDTLIAAFEPSTRVQHIA